MTPAELHDSAMDFADEGDRLHRSGQHEAAIASFLRAMERDRLAAETETTEPSRGILFRSAAWLALEALEPREAERLAAAGLAAKDVNARTADELRAVMEDARVRLQSDLPPPSIASSISLSIEGPEIGYGEADPGEFLLRADAMRSLLFRTAERRQNLPFRRAGPVSAVVRNQLRPRLQSSAGSLIIRLVLGGPQLTLWDDNAALVDDVLACLRANSDRAKSEASNAQSQ